MIIFPSLYDAFLQPLGEKWHWTDKDNIISTNIIYNFIVL